MIIIDFLSFAGHKDPRSLKPYNPKPTYEQMADISLFMQSRTRNNIEPQPGPSKKRKREEEIPTENQQFVEQEIPTEEPRSVDEDLMTGFSIPEAPFDEHVPPHDIFDSAPGEAVPGEEIPILENLVNHDNAVVNIITNDVPLMTANNELVIFPQPTTVSVASHTPSTSFMPPAKDTTKEVNKENSKNLANIDDDTEDKENQIMQLTQGQNSNVSDEFLLTFQREQQLAAMRAQRLRDEQELEKMRMRLFDKVLQSRKM